MNGLSLTSLTADDFCPFFSSLFFLSTSIYLLPEFLHYHWCTVVASRYVPCGRPFRTMATKKQHEVITDAIDSYGRKSVREELRSACNVFSSSSMTINQKIPEDALEKHVLPFMDKHFVVRAQ